ncbi:MAG: HD domain-containing protein [Gemmatimonadota bacterium]|nr:HD domain-containing protein [Gemmatimonadota bacterium]
MPPLDIIKVRSVIVELDKLKGVKRQTLVLGGRRRENAAEHSWHAAVSLLLLIKSTDLDIDLLKLLKMALIHDICEIDHGDTPIYTADHSNKFGQESDCMKRICNLYPEFLEEFEGLWLDYEEQKSPESKLLKVADRILPFFLNLETSGRKWLEQSVSRSQVIAVNQPVQEVMPELYDWIVKQIDDAVGKGWLIDS